MGVETSTFLDDQRQLKGPEEKKKLLISGCGISGIALWHLIDKTKYEVEIIEKADQINTIGYFVILREFSLNLLQEILKVDIKEKYADAFTDIEDFTVFNKEHFYNILQRKVCNISREDLISIISQETGIQEHVNFNKHIQSIESDSLGNQVIFNDGSTENYDIVVVAEGIRSKTRGILLGDDLMCPSGYALEYLELELEGNIETLKGKNFIYNDIYGFLGGIFNLGDRFIISHMYREGEENLDQNREMLKENLVHVLNAAGFNGIKITFPEQEEDNKVFFSKQLLLEQAYEDKVIFLGDSVHGLLPTLGLGTSLALESSYLLSMILNSLHENYSDREFQQKMDLYSSSIIGRAGDAMKKQNVYLKSAFPENSSIGDIEDEYKNSKSGLSSLGSKILFWIYYQAYLKGLLNFDIKKHINKLLK